MGSLVVMRLLDRYLLRELLVPLGYCLGGFLIFWISVDIFSRLNEFQRAGLNFGDILELYFVSTPEMLAVVLPVALLLALLYTLTNHARYHELTAIRAAGVSLWRLSLPYLGVGFLLSIALFLSNELWVPTGMERSEEILTQYTAGKNTANANAQRLFFHNERDLRTWTIAGYDAKARKMSNVHLEWRATDGTWRDIYAQSGVFTNGSWVFSTVQEWRYKSLHDAFPQPSQTNELVLRISETPDLIQSEIKVNSLSVLKAAKRAQIPIIDILNYLRLHLDLNAAQRAKIFTQLHGRIAMPWTCLVVVLIAIPFGAPAGRRNVFVGVASSIFICFTYFVVQQISLSVGTRGLIPAWLAAWLPNLLFGGAGAFLTTRIR